MVNLHAHSKWMQEPGATDDDFQGPRREETGRDKTVMRSSTMLPVPNAILFVADPKIDADYPLLDEIRIVGDGFTILVGVQHPVDGEVSLTMTDELAVALDNPRLFPALRGKLQTPSHEICVQTVTGEVVLRIQVKDDVTPLEVWWDHDRGASEIVIAVNCQTDEPH